MVNEQHMIGSIEAQKKAYSLFAALAPLSSQTRDQEFNNVLSEFLLYQAGTLHQQNIENLYNILLHVEKLIHLEEKAVVYQSKDLEKNLEDHKTKLDEQFAHIPEPMRPMMRPMMEQYMPMIDPDGVGKLVTQKNRLQSEYYERVRPSVLRKSRLYFHLSKYWTTLGYTKEEMDTIIAALMQRAQRDINPETKQISTNIHWHLAYNREAYERTYVYSDTSYHLVPAVVTLLLGAGLLAASFATGEFADFRYVFGLMAAAGLMGSFYANETIAKREFEEEFAQGLIDNHTEKSLAASAIAKRKSSRKLADTFVKENIPALILIGGFFALLVIDMWFLGGMLNVMGHEITISFPVKEFWNNVLLMLIPFAIRGLLGKLPEWATTPATKRTATKLASALGAPLMVYGFGFMFGWFFTVSFVPYIAAIVAGLAFIFTGLMLYMKYVKKADIPNINETLMYSAAAVVVLGVLATAGFLALSNPFTLSVGLIVLSVLYFGGFNKIIQANAAKNDAVREYEAETQEVKEKQKQHEANNPFQSTPVTFTYGDYLKKKDKEMEELKSKNTSRARAI